MRSAVKAVMRAVATAVMAPVALSWRLRAMLIGSDLAFQHSTEWLAWLPGLPGQYLRRAFLGLVTDGCGADVVVCAGTTFSSARVRIEGNAYIGGTCNIAWAHIEPDVMIATAVHVLAPHTHGTERVDIPMRDQPGDVRCIRVGTGAWIGNHAVVMADVGAHAIVAAGAVVTQSVPEYAIVAGVPARVLRDRRTGGEARA
jgi:virginiamycin A acetyltransferase